MVTLPAFEAGYLGSNPSSCRRVDSPYVQNDETAMSSAEPLEVTAMKRMMMVSTAPLVPAMTLFSVYAKYCCPKSYP